MIEFGNIKFPKSISSKDIVWREFLEIENNSTFSKNEYFKSMTFLIIFPSQLQYHGCHKTNLISTHSL